MQGFSGQNPDGNPSTWDDVQRDLNGLRTLHQMQLDLIRQLEESIDQLKPKDEDEENGDS